MLSTRERIITLSDLQQQPQKTIINSQQQPVIVTSDGIPAAYIVSVEQFDAMLERLKLLEENELIANIANQEEGQDLWMVFHMNSTGIGFLCIHYSYSYLGF